MKTYKNDSYTRTVEIIKTTPKCIEYGFTCNVKVTTIYNDTLNIRNGATRTEETRWMATDDYLSYERLGHLYYSKR